MIMFLDVVGIMDVIFLANLHEMIKILASHLAIDVMIKEKLHANNICRGEEVCTHMKVFGFSLGFSMYVPTR